MFDFFPSVDALSLAMLLFIFAALGVCALAGKTVSTRRAEVDPAQDEGLKIVLGATLSLLGLLMGFLLSFAIGGYNTRVSAEENEAIAVGNAFQRTSLMPTERAQDQAKQILNAYLDARIRYYQAPDDTQRAQVRMQSIELQTRMWSFVSAAAKADPNPVMMSLLDACHQLYVSQQKTMASWREQIPAAAWLVLVVFGVCSSFLIGYHMRARHNGLLRLLVVPFITALVLFMIAEIDVPGKGVIHVTPQNLEALRILVARGGLAP